MLSSENQKALEKVSNLLGISPRKMYALINFESGFNPNAENPYSHAKGLIQFTRGTAQNLGYKDQFDLVKKHPTIKSQLLTPVYNYLKAFRPFYGDQSFFMSVFYPKYRTGSIYRPFPDYVQKVNPGIKTPNDYIKKIYLHSGLTYLPPALILIGAGIALFTYLKKGVSHGSKKNQGKQSAGQKASNAGTGKPE